MDGSGAASDASEIDPVDVSNLLLTELIGSDDTALTNSLRRVIIEVERRPENFSGFDSII